MGADGELFTVWQMVMFSMSDLLASEKGYKCTLFMLKSFFRYVLRLLWGYYISVY